MWNVPREWPEQRQQAIVSINIAYDIAPENGNPIYITLHGLPSDVINATLQMPHPVRAQDLRRRIAQVLGIHPSLLRLISPDDAGISLQDWHHATQYIHVEKNQIYPDVPYIDMRDEETGVNFMMPVMQGDTHDSLMTRVEALLRMPRRSLTTWDRDCLDWTYPRGLMRTNSVAVRRVERGGMRRARASRSRSRQRTISTTEPMTEHGRGEIMEDEVQGRGPSPQRQWRMHILWMWLRT